MLERMESVLVIAPHPDDEVLGCGGLIARLGAAGKRVTVCTVTKGRPSRFDEQLITRGRREAVEAHRLLGVAEARWLDLPAAELDTLPNADLNGAIAETVASVAPDTLLLPFVGDLHTDHQLTFVAGLVAARPKGPVFPRLVLAYETLSETNWNASGLSPAFQPNVFIDIEHQLETKLRAMRIYQSQLAEFPNERSLESIDALARVRGGTAFRRAAEAFVLIREVD